MKRAEDIEGSTLGRTVGIRFSIPVFQALRKHLMGNGHDEQFAFGLFGTAKTADGCILIVNDLLLPDRKDLSQQSGGGVAPTKEFQGLVYLMARERRMGILDIHTHPFQSVPTFSGIDEAESARNAQYIERKLPSGATHAMIVFGRDIMAHDAAVFDRSLRAYRTIDCIEVLGRGIELRPTGRPLNANAEQDPRYSRQAMIPGWNQDAIARQRIAVVGAGGNGAQVIQTLLSVGAGTEGWIAAIDPDVLESSNLPRIPYALPDHVGSPKVTIAAQYAGLRNPRVRFYPYPCSATEEAAARRLKQATVLIGAVDGDGVRKFCNELAVRYQTPYIDLGCDIQVANGRVEAGGQIRVVLPGMNACLMCCQGFDPAVAALELLDDAQATARAAQGYVRGVRHRATPSVANLNGATAQLGISAFLSLVHGEKLGKWDYAHYDQLTAKTLVANTSRLASCPVCGPHGILGAGDPQQELEQTEPVWFKTGTTR